MTSMKRFAPLALFLTILPAISPAAAGGGAVAVAAVPRPEAAPTRPIDAGVAPVDEPPVVPVQVLAEMKTTYRTRGSNRRRATNVELAASLLDGAVLEPGATLSFNERVGERTRERGFVVAPVIRNGELDTGIGGGVCQVAGTLHVAALHAGLEIVEHRTHSLPSSYLPAGLDATVSFPSIDYVVRNPYPHPIRVEARAEGGILEVRLHGAVLVKTRVEVQPVREIRITTTSTTDPALLEGEEIVDEEGRAGSVVRVIRSSSRGDLTYEARYPMSPRVVRIGALPGVPASSPPIG